MNVKTALITGGAQGIGMAIAAVRGVLGSVNPSRYFLGR